MNAHERIGAVLAGHPVDRAPMVEQAVAPSVAGEILGRPALTGTTAIMFDEAKVLFTGDDDAYEAFVLRVLDDRAALARALRMDGLTGPWLLGARPTERIDDYTFLYGDRSGSHWSVRRFNVEAQNYQVVDSGAAALTLEDLPAVVEEVEAAAADPQPPAGFLQRYDLMKERYGDEFEIFGGGGLAIPLDPAWLEATIARPDLVDRYLAARVACQAPSLAAQAERGVRLLWAGGDLAGNLGPMYSPKTWRELMVPHVKALTDRCHALGMKYLFRTDGNVWPLGDDFFLHTGIDGYGEIDADAGMDVCEIHAKYPGLVLWGGVASGSVMHRGTAEDVRRATERAIHGTGGRLIVGSSNSIVHGTPAENVLAMVETTLALGN